MAYQGLCSGSAIVDERWKLKRQAICRWANWPALATSVTGGTRAEMNAADVVDAAMALDGGRRLSGVRSRTERRNGGGLS